MPGAGATEIELARHLSDLGNKETGLEQYAIAKYAEALEVLSRRMPAPHAARVVSSSLEQAKRRHFGG